MTRATTLTAFRTDGSPVDIRHPAVAPYSGEHLRDVSRDLSLHIYSDFAAVEAEWRRFERVADCTAFQTFDWLATWHHHIGRRDGIRPAIAVGRYGDGQTAFLLPLCVAPKPWARRLSWLGQELCDYHAPLLAPDFSRRVTPDRFLAAWRQLQDQMQRDPLLRFDWIEFEKMPQTIGGQINPFTHLRISPNASGVHMTQLGDDWVKFYAAKRSSATRRRDRAKLKHMSEYGEIRFITASDPDDARRTLATLIDQKSRALASKGIADIFAPPGHREFYLDVASNPKTRHLVHISRVEIGTNCAAANLGIVFGDCYYHVLASYADGEISHYGPGAFHLRELMAHAIGLGLKRFDFTIGDEPYKLDWSDTDLKLHDYIAAATWRGLPACWSSRIRRRIKRFIKQTPWVWRLVSRVRSAIGALSRSRRTGPPVQASSTPEDRTH